MLIMLHHYTFVYCSQYTYVRQEYFVKIKRGGSKVIIYGN